MILKFRFRYILKCLRFFFTDYFLLLNNKKITVTERSLIIVHTDAIGDYILFRNFIEQIKNSEKYKTYKITLIANELYKDLAQNFDSEFVNEFIWINKSKFQFDFNYRKTILKSIANKQFSVAINPSYSRDFIFGDSIMRAINTIEKIGQKADLSNGYSLFRLLSNFWYTQLIDTGNEIQFEFDRSKKFIEKLIEAAVNLNFPVISLKNKETDLQPYIVLFPGAGEVQKQWSIDNFVTCAKHIINNTKHKIIICGSGNDFPLGEIIIAKCQDGRITNLCGKTTLTELINYVHNAKLLITNDSSAIHIAACTHTVSICIGNGRHYGRFTPYPKEIAPFLHFVFSKNVVKMAELDVENLKKQTLYHSIESINEIDANEVINISREILGV